MIMKRALEKVKKLFQNGGSKMSHVSLNWKCDNCGHECHSHICEICGRELKNFRKGLFKKCQDQSL